MWTLAVVVAIFSTLGLTGTVAELLRHHGLLAAAFAGGMLLVGATIVALGLSRRPRAAEIAVALGVFTAYYMVLLRMALEERSHIITYGVLAAFVHEALVERRSQGRRVPAPWLLALVATSLVGVVDEVIQAFLPSRVFDVQDMVFNTLAAVMAVLTKIALRWARTRSWKGASS